MNCYTQTIAAVFMSIAIFLFGLSLAPTIAQADEARTLHEQGIVLFKENHFEEAALAFRQAYRLRPTWKLLYNIGQCEAAAKRYGLALEAFESYLVQGGDEVPNNRRENVSSEIRRFLPLVGFLIIEAPDNVEIFVDGIARATTSMNGPLRVAAGKHRVVLRQDKRTILEKTVTIGGGISTTVKKEEDVETTEDAEFTTDGTESILTGPEMEKSSIDFPQKRSTLWKVGWIAIGGGAAVLVGGSITGALALSKNNELKDNCPNKESCSEDFKYLDKEARNLAMATDILFPLGGVAVVAGVVLLIIDHKKRPRGFNAANVALAPFAYSDATGLTISGRF